MTKKKSSSRSAQRTAPAPLSVEQALEVVSDDLPDGAWMAQLEELTGLDAGQISGRLATIAKENERG